MQSFLITGGTGSFGQALTKRLLLLASTREVRVLSRDEKKQDDMRRGFADPRLKLHLGDVRSLDSVEQATAGVDCVFHAAALKQVPSCEFYPMETVQTNVLGADNVLKAAHANRVGRVVVLSTDKAAYPINAMGLSKALMEKVMVARARLAAERRLIFCGTRYGNVMGSRGSVIPLFLEQIAHGRPLTITEPTMTRFMLTLEGAIDLVLYAFEHGQPGDLFVQKAPAATIATLADAIRRLLLADDHPAHVIGTRHGEKQFETLVTREEMAQAEDLGGYYRVHADHRDLNYDLYYSEGSTRTAELDAYSSHNARRLGVVELMTLLRQVPDVRQAMAARGAAAEKLQLTPLSTV